MVDVSGLSDCPFEFGSRENWPREPYSWFSGPFCVWRFFVATKLFVGNLSFSTTTTDLEDLFSQVGAVTSATIIMDKFTGKSRGFGFVELANAQDIAAAIERFNGAEVQGRALTVNEAKPQEPRAGGGRAFGGGGGGGRSGYPSGGGGGRDRRG